MDREQGAGKHLNFTNLLRLSVYPLLGQDMPSVIYHSDCGDGTKKGIMIKKVGMTKEAGGSIGCPAMSSPQFFSAHS
ncbi:MAG: hypothetical protein DRP78_05950 [Candidatus Omnitrophota bacterium]|nr:MAG: hypothetical protein DRP78_05950 [Candidatus Omnitrophota bacterium]